MIDTSAPFGSQDTRGAAAVIGTMYARTCAETVPTLRQLQSKQIFRHKLEIVL